VNVAVIGGGVFGSLSALELAALGHRVTLLERNPRLMQGASHNNQNRLHLGFHYPRDDQTALQCKEGFARFLREFGSCVLGNFPNVYFIAREGSRTSPEEFLRFCARHQLPHRSVDVASFRPRVQGVSLAVQTDEVVYDSGLLCAQIAQRLQRAGVLLRTNAGVAAIARRGAAQFLLTMADGSRAVYDGVVNCTYAAANDLTRQLGHRVENRRYEYTAVAIVELDWQTTAGITIIDGPFMTVLPYGKTGLYLLYHVQHVVIARDEAPLLDPAWLDAGTAPFSRTDRQAWFARLLRSCAEYVPDLRRARLRGFLQSPRALLAGREDTDARPSIVTAHEPGYVTVLSGKIDHCVQVAEEVAARLFSTSPKEAAAARAC
jgi:glycine/D-amino acid oxidase-like deaminating enzyme